MTAGTEEYPYQEQETINLDLTLSQFGFPLDGIVVKSSPIVADLDSVMVLKKYILVLIMKLCMGIIPLGRKSMVFRSSLQIEYAQALL